MGLGHTIWTYVFGKSSNEWIEDNIRDSKKHLADNPALVKKELIIEDPEDKGENGESKLKRHLILNKKGAAAFHSNHITEEINIEDKRTDEEKLSEFHRDLFNYITKAGVWEAGVFNILMVGKGGGVSLKGKAGQKFKVPMAKISVGVEGAVELTASLESLTACGTFAQGEIINAGKSEKFRVPEHLIIFKGHCWAIKGGAGVSLNTGFSFSPKYSRFGDEKSLTAPAACALIGNRNSDFTEYEALGTSLGILKTEASANVSYKCYSLIDSNLLVVHRDTYLKTNEATGKILKDYLYGKSSDENSERENELRGSHPFIADIGILDYGAKGSASVLQGKLNMGSIGVTDYAAGSAGASAGKFQVDIGSVSASYAATRVSYSLHTPVEFNDLNQVGIATRRSHHVYRHTVVKRKYVETGVESVAFKASAKLIDMSMVPGFLISGNADDAGTQQFGKGVLTPAKFNSYSKIDDANFLDIEDSINEKIKEKVNHYINLDDKKNDYKKNKP